MKNKKNYLFLGLLVSLVLLSYLPSLFSGFVSDDINAIVESESLLKHASYIIANPKFIVRSALFYFAYQLGGVNPAFFRSINIIFHIGVVILAYLIIPHFSKKRYLAFFVAALTAVHPVMIESVTWISGGIYTQAAFFLLLSLFLYIKNREQLISKSFWQPAVSAGRPESDPGQARLAEATAKRARMTISRLILSLIFYILALSSSEKTIVFPAILILYEYCFFSLNKNWKKIVPFALISIFWIFLLIPFISPRLEYFKTTRGAGLEPMNPFFAIPQAIGAYLQLFIWPQNLSHYHYDIIFSFGNIVLNFILFFCFICGLVFSFIKNRLLFFFLSFFIIGLGITLNSLGFSWLVAERYVYLPSIGLYFIVGYAFSVLISKKHFNLFGWIVFSIIIVSLFLRTVIRNKDWQNSETLWLATAKASPNYVASQNNAANIYVLNGEYENAIEAYKKAIELNPNYSYSYYNLGYTLRLMKRHHEAIPVLKKAISLNPTYWQSYEQLGGIYFELGDFDRSEVYVRKAIALAPKQSMLYAQLGTLLLKKEDLVGAKTAFEKALEIDPQNEVAKEELGKIFL